MKKLSALLICLFILTSCEYEEYFPDYPVVKYEIENSVDGKYTIVYQLRTGFPDTAVDVEVKKSDNTIYKYGTDWNGTTIIPENTSDWNKCVSLPEKVVYLFEYNGGDIYYVQNNTPSSYGSNVYGPSCKIVYDGENVPDFMDCYNYISINMNNDERRQEKLKNTSEFLRENITEQEITDIFDKCGYDDTYIFEIYRYSGKD